MDHGPRRDRKKPESYRPRHGRHDLVLIGWNEYVEIPAWGIHRLRAKVDTGARNSALHVENIEELPRGRVSFDVVLHREKLDRRVSVETRIRRRGRVRSSTGHYATRIFVAARVSLGGIDREVELSLVDRERMIFRMLLGRTALAGAFLVDVGHAQLLGKPLRRRPREHSRER